MVISSVTSMVSCSYCIDMVSRTTLAGCNRHSARVSEHRPPGASLNAWGHRARTSDERTCYFPNRARCHLFGSCSTHRIPAGPRAYMIRRALRDFAAVHLNDRLPLWRLPALQTAAVPKEGDEPEGLAEEEGHVSITELLRFTAPTLGIWMINPILSLVDTSVVGTRSAIELAALGPGTSLCDSLSYVCTFLATATTNMLALSLARRDRQQIVSTLSNALVISGLVGLVVAAAMYLGAPAAVRLFAGSASLEVIPPAVEYVRWRVWGMPAALLIFVGQAYFLAARDPVTPLLVALFAGVFNFAGDILLCNYFNLGIVGASAATSIAQVLAAGALVWAMNQPLRDSALLPGFVPDIRLRIPNLQVVRVFLSYAGPVCGVLLSKVFMYGSLTAVATKLGPQYVGAHHITVTTFAFFATVGDAVSTGAQAFLPEVVRSQPLLLLCVRTPRYFQC
eukprot:jgi/Botrbrau1/3005/Bobra.0070s0004.2